MGLHCMRKLLEHLSPRFDLDLKNEKEKKRSSSSSSYQGVQSIYFALNSISQQLHQVVAIPPQIDRHSAGKRIRFGPVIDQDALGVEEAETDGVERDTAVPQDALRHLAERLGSRRGQDDLRAAASVEGAEVCDVAGQDDSGALGPARGEVLARVLEEGAVDVDEEGLPGAGVGLPGGKGAPVLVGGGGDGDEGGVLGEHFQPDEVGDAELDVAGGGELLVPAGGGDAGDGG